MKTVPILIWSAITFSFSEAPAETTTAPPCSNSLPSWLYSLSDISESLVRRAGEVNAASTNLIPECRTGQWAINLRSLLRSGNVLVDVVFHVLRNDGVFAQHPNGG